MTYESPFIIAEVGVNHNGDIGRALELIDVSAGLGADAVKFQSFRTADLASDTAQKADYQVKQTGSGDQQSMLAELELSEADHHTLMARCDKRGIEFMSTPFDLQSAAMLADLGVKRLKLGSGDLDNVPLLRALAALGLPLILSTGMADMEEVVAAKDLVEQEWKRLGLLQADPSRLTVLHCTSNYPALPEDVNLLAMQTMQGELDCPVGYSDHTEDIFVAVAATALGASVIEKHITLDCSLPGPDHAASLEPDQFGQLVRNIRELTTALGDGIKAPRPSEMPVKAVARRSIALSQDLPKGHIISGDDLVMLRPATGIAPSKYDEVIGRVLAREVFRGTLLSLDDLAP